MSSRSKAAMLLLLFAGVLAAQTWPYVLDETRHALNGYTYAATDLVIDGRGSVFSLGDATPHTPTITLYDQSLDSLTSWATPPASPASVSQYGCLSAADEGCLYIGARALGDTLRPYLARLDANCDTLWTHHLTHWGAATGRYIAIRGDEIYCIVKPVSDSLYSLARCTSEGDVLWSIRIVGEQTMAPTSLETLADTLLLVTSQTTSAPNQDVTLTAYDWNGELAWGIIGDTGQDDFTRCVVPLDDGGFAWAISQYSHIDGHFMASVYRYDSQPELLWSNITTESAQTIVRAGAASPDGGLYLGGSVSAGDDLEAWLWRLDASGNSEWTTSFAYDMLEKVTALCCTQDNAPILNIWNRDDENGVESLLATVAPFYVNFDTDNTYGPPPLHTEFIATATGPIEEWMWDFDSDGAVDATGELATWTYDASGVYDVTLTVGANGCYSSFTRQHCVTVEVGVDDNTTSPGEPMFIDTAALRNGDVRFSLPQQTQARVDMFNVRGQHVACLANGAYPAGRHTARAPQGLASGVYLLRLQAGRTTITTRALLLK